MPRRYAHGRFTKQDPGEAFRKNGLINALGNKGVFGDHLDQLLYEAGGYEYLLGSEAQLSAEIANLTWNQSTQRFEEWDGSEVILQNWDRIAVIGMDTLTADMVIDNVEHLEIFHIGNGFGQSGDDPKFKLGDSGGGVPYKIKFGPNTANCKLDLLTDKTFKELDLSLLTQVQKQYIANQGRGNYIKVNGEEIYNPSEAGNIITKDTPPPNPYLLRMNATLWPWSSNAAVDGLAWFRDLNIALDGSRWDGSQFVETQSRYTFPALISASPWLFKLGFANRFMTDISALDTRVHQRTDPTGVSIAATANFNGTNLVVFSSGIGNIKNGMRIQGAGVPGSSAATTILKLINTSINAALMFDGLTGAPVNVATASGVGVTIDNSGAAGGSHDDDYFQGHHRDE